VGVTIWVYRTAKNNVRRYRFGSFSFRGTLINTAKLGIWPGVIHTRVNLYTAYNETAASVRTTPMILNTGKDRILSTIDPVAAAEVVDVVIVGGCDVVVVGTTVSSEGV